MPATDSPAIIVARFLKSNNYTESYDAFIAEAGLPFDAGTVSKGDLTLETLLEEKKVFDVSVSFEKLGADGEGGGWRKPAPEVANAVTTLPSTSNILSTAVERTRSGDGATISTLLVTTADRRLHILDAAARTLRTSLAGLQDSPILSCVVFRQRYLLTASMSGQLIVSDIEGSTIDKRRDHTKYVVKIAVHDNGSSAPLIATAAWDCKVVIYKPSVEGSLSLGEPTATIILPTKPEAMLFVQHPETSQPVMLISRTDSTFLYYYTTDAQPRLIGRQNLAPHSNAWVAFTPSALAICPTDPSLLAVGTSTIPHMKLLVVRLLTPPYAEQVSSSVSQPSMQQLRNLSLDETRGTETQASQARAALAVADRESGAILIHCTTMAPQTAYSTPAVAWRPDGSGVWVNGDDGAVRGVEVSSGKVVSTLQGHELGSKVRCLWAGDVVDGEGGREEVLVSGGFDQKLLVWKTGSQ